MAMSIMRAGEQPCRSLEYPCLRESHRIISPPSSDSLDRAMVECFEVPEKDRFVAFHQHQPGELIFDRTYRGGPRSDGYIFFHVTTGKTRTSATKQRFYGRLVEHLTKAPGVRPEDVMVVIANSTFEDWSFASGVSAAGSIEQMAG